jgi:hypothetical protein
VSHGDRGQYLIVLSSSQLVRRLGVDVEMYVVGNSSIARHKYLRRVTLDTFLQYGEDLYADKEDEPDLMREFVDTTFVSGIYKHIMRSGVDYVFERGKGDNKELRRQGRSVSATVLCHLSPLIYVQLS